MIHATPCAYRLPDDSRIEEVRQRDGSSLWAVRTRGGCCLNREGQWEYEPQPSSRDDDFFSRCRWSSAEDAYLAWGNSVSTQ